MKVLVALDSFKGSISSKEANEAVKKALDDHDVICKAIGDGGENTMEAIADSLNGNIEMVEVCGPLNNKIIAIEKVYQEQQKSIDDLENRINYINNGVIEEVWDSETKKLVYNIKMGENTFNGSIKASNIFQVKIGREDASVNENGEINIGTRGELNYLCQSVYENGQYTLVKEILPSSGISAGDGLEINGGKINIKIDDTSNTNLSVSQNGLKLNDIPVDKISDSDIENYFK